MIERYIYLYLHSKEMIYMEDLLGKWTEIKTLVEALELDVHKNANGNHAAGIRSRKGLRALKVQAASLVKLMVERDKQKS